MNWKPPWWRIWKSFCWRWARASPSSDGNTRSPSANTSSPTIGLLLCQTHDSVLAEYALRGIDKPIGIAGYELTRALPTTLQSVLPSIEALEAELAPLPSAATDSSTP